MGKNKKLKILLMNPWQEYFLGAENFSFAMARELIRLEYSVDAFCYLKGKMWEKMGETGAKLLGDDIKDEYDIAICHGNPCMPLIPKSAFKINCLHGVIPSQEQPLTGADRYVAVSEEVKQNLRSKGFDSVIIRNGVDCERFKSINPINKKLKNVLLLSNKQNPHSLEFLAIEGACQRLKLDLMVCGLQYGTSQWEIEDIINHNDIVISLGRGIYEAMACGRNAIICDYQGMEGFVDKNLYLEARKNNCSGRRFRKAITQDSVIDELKKYNAGQGEINRKLALEYHDIKKVVQNFLDLYTYKNLNV